MLHGVQQIARDRSRLHHITVLPSQKLTGGELVQKREEWIEKPSDVQESKRLAVKPELSPCPDLEKLLEGPNTSWQSDESVGKAGEKAI